MGHLHLIGFTRINETDGRMFYELDDGEPEVKFEFCPKCGEKL